MVVFFAPQVRDASTGQILAGLVGQFVTIVYPGTSDPVAVTEYPSNTAIPGAVLTVSSEFSLTSFNTPAGVYAVEALASNGARARLETNEGARIAAEEAAVSASDAADAAQIAQAVAEDIAASMDRALLPADAADGDTTYFDATSGLWVAGPPTGGGGGEGTVTTINGIGPNGSGDVELDAGQVGAAADEHNHDASDVSEGTFDVARIPNMTAGKITSGTFDAARIPDLGAAKIDSGTLDRERLPEHVQTVNGEAGEIEINPENIEAVRNTTPADFGGLGVGTELPTAGAGKRLFILVPE